MPAQKDSKLASELRQLAQKKRTRKNFEAIGDQLAELAENAKNCSEALDTIQSARESAQELIDKLDAVEDGNPLLSNGTAICDAAILFLDSLPGSDDSDDSIQSLIEEAQEAHEGYEEIMDDREYDATARDEAWGELCNALDNIANALDS